jgi:hypothetical protein
VPFGQWCCETGQGTSSYWIKNLNPGGLRITFSGEVSNTWANGRVAALGMLHRLCLYIYGTAPDAISDGLPFDPAPQAVGQAGYLGIAKKIQDLSTRWAADPNYANVIQQRLNAAFVSGSDAPGTPTGAPPVSTPTTIVFGRVPYPQVIESHFAESNPWISVGAPPVPEAVVWHRMVGTWEGTNSYGHSGNFATSYGISVQATDGVGGKIYEWIDPNSNLYGESSGPVSAPYGDGLALVNKVGIPSVNRMSKAIEISGNYETPVDQAAKHAVAALTAYYADKKKIAWDQFPLVPGENRSFVVWHQELTIGTGKVCPGQVVMDATPEMIEMCRAILKQYQVVVSELPQYKKAPTYDWLARDTATKGQDQMIGTTPVYAIPGGGRNFTVIKEAARLSAASLTAQPSGPPMPVDTKFHADYIFRAGDGNSYVLTSPAGNRVAASYLDPKLYVFPNGRITERDPYTEPKGTTIRKPNQK